MPRPEKRTAPTRVPPVAYRWVLCVLFLALGLSASYRLGLLRHQQDVAIARSTAASALARVSAT